MQQLLFLFVDLLNGKSFAVKELQAMMMKERDEDVFKAIVNMMLCDVEDMKLTAGGFFSESWQNLPLTTQIW